MIQIGRYQLDVEEMVLSCDNQRVVLEPKVCEVLAYFCQHHNRYISMAELHENIWQGRCVSDAAVRRIISKIRILMNDDHKNPTYIQSLPKRGYKLICAVEHNVEAISQSSVEPPFPETSGAVALNAIESTEHLNSKQDHETIKDPQIDQSEPATVKPSRLKFVLLALFLLCIAIIGYWVKPWFSPPTIQTHVVNTLPGDKIAVTQSADGSYLAFSGQVQNEAGFQIFVKHQSDFDFRPITQQAHLPGALAFSADNQYLYFSDSTQNNSSLNRINIKSGNSSVEVIADNYAVISDVFTARVSNNIFFAGKKTAEQPFLIYEYDIKNKEIKTITASSQSESLDIKGDVSFDGIKLAVLRTNLLSHNDEIRVIDLKTQEVLIRRPQEAGVYDITWLNNDTLLILERNKLVQVNLATGYESVQLAENVELGNLDSIYGQVLAVSLGMQKQLFVEKKLPFKDFTTRRILQKDIYQMSYFGDKTLALLKSDGITQLGFLNLDIEGFESIIATEYDLSVIEADPKSGKILVKINRRFALLDPNQINLEFITSGDDFIGDASFTEDGGNILFTTKNYDRWGAYTYDIQNKSVELLINDARYIRPFGDDYIIGDANGKLFFYNSLDKKMLSLNYSLSKELNTQWAVKNNYIYWSSHDLVNTTFYQLNIDDRNNPSIETHQFIYNEVKPEFSIDASNTYFLMPQTKNVTSEVVKLVIE